MSVFPARICSMETGIMSVLFKIVTISYSAAWNIIGPDIINITEWRGGISAPGCCVEMS